MFETLLLIPFYLSLVHCLPLTTDSEYDGGGANILYLGASVFGKPSEKSGEKLKTWTKESGVNPEELGEYAEGDILFPAKFSRNGLIAETARWVDGVIPYQIDAHFTSTERQIIKKAMEQYHKYTCIKFRQRSDSDPDWISIVSTNSGCWSSIGRTGGRQEVNLQSPGCLIKIGTVMHELLHAVGFHHEQNRWERDSYVNINWRNIQKGKESNFKKATKESVSGFGVPYDYGSVMHYSEKAFSQNGEATISVTQDSDVTIGQREGFSQKDVEKVRAMYNCPASNASVPSIDYNPNNSENHGGGGVIGGLVSILFP